MTVKRHFIEVVEEKKRAAIIYDKPSKFIPLIKKRLAENYSLYENTNPNAELSGYDLLVYIDTFPGETEVLKQNKKAYFFYFFNREEYLWAKKWVSKNLRQYKLVNIGPINRPIGEILDFVFHKTPLPYEFDFSKSTLEKHEKKKKELSFAKLFFKMLKTVLWLVLFLNLIHIFVLGYEVSLFWKLKNNLNDDNLTTQNLSRLIAINSIAEGTVNIPKNTLFWVPGVEGLLNFSDATTKSARFVEKAYKTFNNYSLLGRLILKKTKTEAEIKEAKLRVETVRAQTKELDADFSVLLGTWKQTGVPFLNTQKKTLLNKAEPIADYFSLAEKLNANLPYLLGEKESKKYLVLFMNNMELRPGGGFIGSVAMISVSNYTMEDFKVYDVYTLDGQLKSHINPPEPIRDYLNQPHWFLRDSNFSPDFAINSKQALDFVNKEVGWDGFDGVFGITLTSVKKLIGIFPDLTASGYEETITEDNFFLKAQTYAEGGFFPGSHGKANFLNSVVGALMLRFEEGDFDVTKLVRALVGLFEEKQMVVYFQKEEVEEVFDNLFWTGKMVLPKCSYTTNCYVDYLNIVDANLGVNKANFFVQRSIRLLTDVNSEKKLSSQLIIDYKNESAEGIFPGGIYKNYLQIYLPWTTRINKISINGEQLPQYTMSNENGFRKLGFLFSVLPEGQTSVEILYEHTNVIDLENPYQLIVQKQVGSINNDFVFEFKTDRDIVASPANFDAVVRDAGFLYNTYLQRDRILLINFNNP